MTSNPAGEVFRAFLKLGLTSFGGPVAHLGYFREEFVVRRRWIDESIYADLVALCQFLPGPASSQVGFALGLQRAGLIGAVAAWAAFTLPSALLMVAFTYSASALSGPVGASVVDGLKLVAVAVVAQAVCGMARNLAPDLARGAIAVGAAALVAAAGPAGQIGAIALGALLGSAFCTGPPSAPAARLDFPVSRRAGIACLVLFAALLAGTPLLVAAGFGGQGLALFDAFYRAGALVFGGGHVVLPLLQAEVVGPGWTSEEIFVAGYGAAQAVPGPLFTFAAYLGAVVRPEPNGFIGSAIALVAVFLPGLLILVGALPFWGALRDRPSAQSAVRGANAAVVGVLAAALYDPVWTSAVQGLGDGLVAGCGFLALTFWRAPSWLVIAGIVAASVALAFA